MLKLKTKFRLIVTFYMMLPVTFFIAATANTPVFHDPAFEKALTLCLVAILVITMCIPFLAGLKWLFLNQLHQITDICQDIKTGHYRYFTLPNQPAEADDENELLALMRTMNWMIHRIENREIEFEARVAQRTRDLEASNAQLIKARDEANASAVAKSQFLATMSHEIRTPLNAISGMSDLVLGSNLDEHQKECMEIINSAGKNLLRIINDILDFSKMDADKLILEAIPVSVREMAEEVMDLFKHEIADKSIELIPDIAAEIPLQILADPMRLKQVLLNLLSNAVKFTQEGEISLGIHEFPCEKPGWTRIAFSVRDTGIGMDEETTRHLFQAFSQADGSTSRKYGGTGLGLAISGKLVSLMGGQIKVHSHPDKGSTFSFVLETEVVAPFKKPAVSGSLKKIDRPALLVVQNLTIRRILEQYLNNFGLSAVPADRIPEQISGYAFIILDLDIPPSPDANPFSRCISNPEQVPIIGIGAFNTKQMNQPPEWLRKFVPKPVKQSTLFDAIMETVTTREKVTAPEKPCASIFPGPEKIRVLLVEDNRINQKVALEMLRSAGITPAVADTGSAALAWLEQNPCDAVLMDVQMPGMDGYEATREIKHRAASKHLPVIGMSANAMPEDQVRGRQAGMDAYITKPVTPSLLYETLSRILDRPLAPGIKQSLEKKTPEECILEDFPGIDVPSALSRIQGDAGLLKGFLLDFISENKTAFDQAEAMLISRDIKGFKALVHQLKGASQNLSASALSENLICIETRLNEKTVPFDPADPGLFKILQACRQNFETISQGVLPAKQGTVPATQGNPRETDSVFFSQALEMAGRMEALLSSNSLNAKSFSKDFTRCLSGTAYEAGAARLESRVRRFDFASARAVFEDLKKNLSRDQKAYGNQ